MEQLLLLCGGLSPPALCRFIPALSLRPRRRSAEANLLKLNCDKAHAELKWHSVLTSDECLQITSEWYKISYEGFSNEAYKFCTKQIMEYVERAKERKLNWPD